MIIIKDEACGHLVNQLVPVILLLYSYCLFVAYGARVSSCDQSHIDDVGLGLQLIIRGVNQGC